MLYIQTDNGLNQTEGTDSKGRITYLLDLTEAINTQAIATEMNTKYSFSFQYAGVTGSGTLKAQFSIDGINWIDDIDNSGTAITYTVDSNRIDTLTYIGTTKGELLRFNIDGLNTAGTVLISEAFRGFE